MATVSQSRNRARARNANARTGPALFDDMLNMAGSLASSRKEYAAAQLESLADSVRQFTDVMPDIPTMKAYAETAAESLDDLASYVTESDLSEIVSQKPILFSAKTGEGRKEIWDRFLSLSKV